MISSQVIELSKMEIKRYTKDRISDVLQFERDLRAEENLWGWEIDEKYIANVTASFEDPAFANSLSLLAYIDGKVVARIDSAKICSRFDGSVKAYLDWICVIKSYRHKGVAQMLLKELRRQLKKSGVETLIALTDSNEASQRFYRKVPNSEIRIQASGSILFKLQLQADTGAYFHTGRPVYTLCKRRGLHGHASCFTVLRPSG